MAARLLPLIARQQGRLLIRDRRLALLGGTLLLVLATVAITSVATRAAADAQRAEAQVEEAHIWEQQGPANPHGAAHFGRYVYKPVSPLAALDPGLLPQLGSSLRLEAHASHPAHDRTIDGGTALSRFDGLSAARLLQAFAPLLVILAGFATFAGPQARKLLRQELATGVAPSTLVAGRLSALALIVLALPALIAVLGGLVLRLAGGGMTEVGALLWMMLGYALYLYGFAALTMAASAAFASARTALAVLLAFWAVAILFVPRIAPAVAEAAVPTMSGPALEAAVTHEVREGPSGHDPQDERLERLREATMRKYRVSRIEDLPVDFGGISLFHGEALSTSIYRRHAAALYDAYDRQAAIQRAFALLSPLQAIRPLSAALAQSDLHAHRRFLEQAERFRYATVQRLNRDIIANRKTSDAPYLADVGAITRAERFVARPVALRETLGRGAPDLALLALWAALTTLLALAAGTRLREGSAA